VVYKGDRLARDTMLDGYLRFVLKRHSVGVVSASERDTAGENPTARLTQAVLAAVAEFERHLIRQRLSAARRLKKAKGGYSDGRPRYGYRAENASLVADEHEQAAILVMRRLRRRGESFRGVAAALQSGGYQSRQGNTWHPFTVKRILSRKTPKPKSVNQGSGTVA
jgi:DNA invertase Pin-like site-specific DNA recombinase